MIGPDGDEKKGRWEDGSIAEWYSHVNPGPDITQQRSSYRPGLN